MVRSVTVGIPSLRTPPSGFGISTRLTGFAAWGAIAKTDDLPVGMTMGNGGSASTASHFVCDFNKGLSYGFSAPRYKFICLNDSLPSLTAYSNDVSYEDAFLEQLKNFFRAGDVVVGISGSGNSKNVLKAIEYANANGGISVGLTGYNGGELKKIAQISVHVPIDDMQVAEDAHMMLDHLAMSAIRDFYSEK